MANVVVVRDCSLEHSLPEESDPVECPYPHGQGRAGQSEAIFATILLSSADYLRLARATEFLPYGAKP